MLSQSAIRSLKVFVITTLSSLLLASDAVAITIGPYNKDVTYTIWRVDPKTAKRAGDPVAENVPLPKDTKEEKYKGECMYWSLKIDPPSNWNSFAFIATDGANNAIDLDSYLFGMQPIAVPSIFLESNADTMLLGIVDVKTFYENFGQFNFDPNNITTFNFVNGVSPLLPGFTVALTSDLNMFHDQAFEFVNGVGVVFDPSSGASLFTGTATAQGVVLCDTCPEPSTAVLCLMCGSLFVAQKLKKCRVKLHNN